MTELPAGWTLATIDTLTGGKREHSVIGPFGSNLKVSDYRESGVPLVFVRNVRAKRFDSTGPHVSKEKAIELAAHGVLPGDVLITKMGEPPGEAAVYAGMGPAILTADCIRLRLSPHFDSRYIAYAFDAPQVRKQFDDITRGVAQRKVSLARFRNAIRIPTPAIEEQRRIVRVLEDHLSRLDAANMYLDSVRRRAETMKRAVFHAALDGRLVVQAPEHRVDPEYVNSIRASRYPLGTRRGRPEALGAMEVKVPWSDSWTTMSLEQLTDPVRTISYGILKPGPSLASGIPYVRVVNMRGDVIDVGALHRTSAEIAGQYARSSLCPGDVLISIRGTYGRVAEVPRELDGANITQDTARLAFLPVMLPAFAAVVLRSPYVQQILKRVARGVAVKGVNIGDLRAVPLPVPPIDVQHEVVSRVAELTSDVGASFRSAESASLRAASLRRGLLQAAFSGRLTSDDELEEGRSE